MSKNKTKNKKSQFIDPEDSRQIEHKKKEQKKDEIIDYILEIDLVTIDKENRREKRELKKKKPKDKKRIIEDRWN